MAPDNDAGLDRVWRLGASDGMSLRISFLQYSQVPPLATPQAPRPKTRGSPKDHQGDGKSVPGLWFSSRDGAA